MRKHLHATLICVAFFAVLGIAGSVEQGAALARMIWSVPILAVGAYGVIASRE